MGFFTGMVSPLPQQFALKMAEKVERQFPPKSEPQLAKKGAQRRLEGVLQPIMNDLVGFQREHQLGWIGKARLGNAFRWALAEKGYSKEFVEALTEGVVRTITTTKAKPS
jgi:hypothetical protein